MIDRIAEWLASRSDPRFRLYREARLAYEEVIQELGTDFQDLTEEHYQNAAADERLRSAQRSYREAIELSRSSGAAVDAATAFSQLGMLLHLTHDWPEAETCFRDAVVIFEELAKVGRRQQTALSSCYYHLGLLDLKRQRFQRARRWLLKSIAIDEEQGDVGGLMLGRRALERCPAPVDGDEDNEDAEPLPEAAPLPIPPADRDMEDRDMEEKPAGEAIVALPGPFGEVTQEVLWILASSEEAGRAAQEAAAEACPIHRDLKLLLADFASGSTEPPPTPPGARLCGAVLVIDRDALASAGFRYFAAWCISRVESTDDFRVFVHLRGMGETELKALSAENGLMAELLDSVHLHQPEDLGQLRRDLSAFLLDLDLIRDRARWRRWRAAGTWVIGGLSTLVLGAVIFVWLAASASTLLWNKAAVVSRAAALPLERDWIGFLGGIPIFWAHTIVLAFLFRGMRFANRILEKRPRTGRWLVFGLIVINASLWLPLELHAKTSAIIAGVAWGILLEVARRSRASQSRRHLLSRGFAIAKSGRFPLSLLTPGGQDPMSWPLFPPPPEVFISYSRSSEWGEACAAEIHRQIHATGGDSFRDQESIPPGASWRRELDQRLGESMVLIVLCDRLALRRPWVAAEVIAALEARHRSGTPEILVLKEPSVQAEDLAHAQSVFRSLLSGAGGDADTAPRQIVYRNTETICNLVAGLSPQRYQMSSVFPLGFASVLRLLALPAVALATLVPVLGVPALLLALGVHLGKIDLQSWFGPATIWWLCLLVAFTLGATLRQAIGARFEGRAGPKGKSVFSTMRFSAIGTGVLLPSLLAQTDGLGSAWSGAVLWFGWLVTSTLLRQVGKHPPKSNG